MRDIDFEPRVLRFLIAAADGGSLSAASRAVRLAQPWLSSQLKSLEQDLGFEIFCRTPRGLTPTEKGTEFLARARRLLEANGQLNGLVRVLSGREPSATVIGASLFTCFIRRRVALTEGFNEKYPDVALSIDNRSQVALLRDLRTGHIDLAFGFGTPLSSTRWHEVAAHQETQAELAIPDDLERITIGGFRPSLLVHKSHQLASRPQVTLAELSGLTVVMFHPLHGPIYDQVAGPMRHAAIEIVHAPEGNCVSAERYGLQRRIPTVSLGWFSEPDAAETVRIPVDDLPTVAELRLLRGARLMKPAAELFWTYTETACRAEPATVMRRPEQPERESFPAARPGQSRDRSGRHGNPNRVVR